MVPLRLAFLLSLIWTSSFLVASLAEEPKQQQQQQCEGDAETCRVRIVQPEELAKRNGKKDQGDEIWLSILGQVYDVSKGTQYYAEGSGYHVFAGQDATISFITGNFTDDEAQKSTEDLSAAQLHALFHEWVKFYENEERYPFVGFLQGRFYDAQGNPTEELNQVHERVKSYEVIKAQKDKERKEKREARARGMMAGRTTGQ